MAGVHPVLTILTIKFAFISYAISQSESMKLIKEYDQKVCAGEPTCHITTEANLPAIKRMLPHRNCMCDYECTEYNDCCQDSMFFEYSKLKVSTRSYYCSPSYKIYMVSTCSSEYSNQVVIEKCSSAVNNAPENNEPILITPVINKMKRITYANEFCAICNGETIYMPLASKIDCSESSGSSFNSNLLKSSPNRNPAQNTNSGSNTEITRGNMGIHSDSRLSLANQDLHTIAKFNNPIPGICDCHKSTEAPSTFAPIPMTQPSISPYYYPYPTANEISPYNNYNNLNIHIQVSFGPPVSQYRAKRAEFTDSSRFGRQISNSIELTDAIASKLKYDYNSKNYVAKIDGKQMSCNLELKYPKSAEGYVRHCVPDVISECSSDPSQNELCQSYMDLRYENKNNKIYRNLDCALCNGVDINTQNLTACFRKMDKGGSALFSAKGNSPNANNPADEKLIAQGKKFE